MSVATRGYMQDTVSSKRRRVISNQSPAHPVSATQSAPNILRGSGDWQERKRLDTAQIALSLDTEALCNAQDDHNNHMSSLQRENMRLQKEITELQDHITQHQESTEVHMNELVQHFTGVVQGKDNIISEQEQATKELMEAYEDQMGLKNNLIGHQQTQIEEVQGDNTKLMEQVGEQNLAIAGLKRNNQDFISRLDMTTLSYNEVTTLYTEQLEQVQQFKQENNDLRDQLQETQSTLEDVYGTLGNDNTEHRENAATYNHVIMELEKLRKSHAVETEALKAELAMHQSAEHEVTIVFNQTGNISKPDIVSATELRYTQDMENLLNRNITHMVFMCVLFVCACLMSLWHPGSVYPTWLLFFIAFQCEFQLMQYQVKKAEMTRQQFRAQCNDADHKYWQNFDIAYQKTNKAIFQSRPRVWFGRFTLCVTVCFLLHHIFVMFEGQEQINQIMSKLYGYCQIPSFTFEGWDWKWSWMSPGSNRTTPEEPSDDATYASWKQQCANGKIQCD